MVGSFRESGNGESARPTPHGDFDGTTRVDAMRALLAGDKTDRKARLLKRLRRPFLERVGKAMAYVTMAGIIWIGPKLSPQEAADVLRPHQTVFPCECFNGPYSVGTTEVQVLTADYRAMVLRRTTESVSRGTIVLEGRSPYGGYDRRRDPLVHLPTVQPVVRRAK